MPVPVIALFPAGENRSTLKQAVKQNHSQIGVVLIWIIKCHKELTKKAPRNFHEDGDQ